jgi:hypothetical protein
MSDFIENVRERHGLFHNVPRSLRQAVARRMAALEADRERFDLEAAQGHGRLKRLYAVLHLESGERAKATLFGKPPADSPRAALRRLARTSDPREQAEIVRRHRFPFRVVESTLGTITPPVAVALVETLDADELLTSLPLLAKRGLLRDAVREALLRRLHGLARARSVRVRYQQIESLVRKAELDRQLATAAFGLLETAERPAALEGSTALLVDASASMGRDGGCLELAAQVGWRLDGVLAAGAHLHVYLFGPEGWPVSVRRGSGLDRWRAALTPPPPTVPGTSAGAALERLRQHGHDVARLVVVTDGYENRPPRLATAYEGYRGATGLRPSLHLVQPAGAGVQLAVDLRGAQVPFTVFTMDQHLLGLEGLVPALAAQAQQDRVAQVLAFR